MAQESGNGAAVKKIVLAVSITPNDGALRVDDVVDALARLGGTHVQYMGEVGLGNSDGLRKETWLFASADEDVPFIAVAQRGECHGRELSSAEVDALTGAGVCVELYGEYPRFDRFGPSLCATGEEFASVVVGEHGFKIDPDNFHSSCNDRGDDGAEEFWLKIVSPA